MKYERPSSSRALVQEGSPAVLSADVKLVPSRLLSLAAIAQVDSESERFYTIHELAECNGGWRFDAVKAREASAGLLARYEIPVGTVVHIAGRIDEAVLTLQPGDSPPRVLVSAGERIWRFPKGA